MELVFVGLALAVFALLGAVAFQERRHRSDAPTEPGPAPGRYVVFDLETTGLDFQKSEIIEIGAIKVDGNSQASFQMLVRPKRRIPARITELTGISQAMVERSGQPLQAALVEFAAFVEDLPLVAFNAHFDMTFLRRSGKRYKIRFPNTPVCALKMSRRAWPTEKSHRLTALATLLDLPQDETHRALGDCRRTLEVYKLAAGRLGRSGIR